MEPLPKMGCHAEVEQRGDDWCVVMYDMDRVTVVGRYRAKYQARRHADEINDNIADDL